MIRVPPKQKFGDGNRSLGGNNRRETQPEAVLTQVVGPGSGVSQLSGQEFSRSCFK